ncbi:hypothetical protein EDB86DRAFT_1908439 [Lactarius hatsudake]|nr:hypothetical protein EDB86DRAFT_1908439 [Lactarius hatsudake]
MRHPSVGARREPTLGHRARQRRGPGYCMVCLALGLYRPQTACLTVIIWVLSVVLRGQPSSSWSRAMCSYLSSTEPRRHRCPGPGPRPTIPQPQAPHRNDVDALYMPTYSTQFSPQETFSQMHGFSHTVPGIPSVGSCERMIYKAQGGGESGCAHAQHDRTWCWARMLWHTRRAPVP